MMKRVLCICIMLWAVAQAQVPEQYLGNPNNRVVTKGQHKVDSIFFAPNRPDTLFNPGLPAALIFRSTDKHFYFYDGTAWKRILQIGDAANPTWGTITGTLSTQTDLQAALNAKQNTITTGTTSQYLRGDLSLAVFPTSLSSFTNDPGYLTSSTGVPSTRTLTINGTTFDLSANRTWSVGDVTQTGTQTLTNKTLTSPIINVGSDATGDLYYRNGGGLFTRLPIGGSGQILSVSGGLPSWQPAATGGTLQTVTNAGDTTTNRVAAKWFTAAKTISPAIANADSLVGFGHSIMYGQNASPPDSNFLNRTGRYFSLAVSNQGVPSTAIFSAVKAQMQWINSPTHRGFTVYMAALNDIRTTNVLTNRKTINAIVNGYKAMWLNHFADTTVAASAGTVTRSGTWNTNWDASAEGGKKTNAAYTGNSGAYIEWTTVDSSIAVSLMGNVTGGCNAVVVTIDGVTVQTFNLNNQNDGVGHNYMPTALIYTGLTFGTHTIRLTNSNGSGLMIVDYFTSLRDAASAPSFMIWHDPHLDATGYAGGQASDAAIDTVNSKVDSMVATLPNPWASARTRVAKTELYYVANTSSGLSSDHIHPNNLGHGQMFQAGYNAINSTVIPPGQLQYGTDGNYYGDGKPLAYANQIGLQNVINNNPTLNAPSVITGSSSLAFTGMSSISLNQLQVTSLTGQATTRMYGNLGAYGSSASLTIWSRNIDTTKGFQFYSVGTNLNLYDLYKTRNVITIDTSLRTLFTNNPNTSSLTAPTATVHIGGNTFGAAAHAPLKFGKSILLVTPEAGAVELDSLNTWITDMGGVRQAAVKAGGQFLGAALTVGTKDANVLNFLTNNTQQLQIGTTIPTGSATDSLLVINSTVLKKVARTATAFVNTVGTTDATPTTITTIAVPTSAVIIVDVDITFASGSDRSSFSRKIRVKNISGTLTILNTSTIGTDYTGDAPLSTSTVSATASGTNLLLQVAGVAATSGTWTANGNYKTE